MISPLQRVTKQDLTVALGLALSIWDSQRNYDGAPVLG
jgi:hypothetical protein